MSVADITLDCGIVEVRNPTVSITNLRPPIIDGVVVVPVSGPAGEDGTPGATGPPGADGEAAEAPIDPVLLFENAIA